MQVKKRTKITVIALLLWFGGHSLPSAWGDDMGSDQPSESICIQALGSDCDATQAALLHEFLRDLDLYSHANKLKEFKGEPPAFEALPKDKLGFINWIKAVTDGVIAPLGSLTGEEDEYEGFLSNLIVFQVKAHFMADVIFPHGMHTYWVGCDSCHPEPFEKKRGSSKIVMSEMFNEGKWCGKCHGKVAFPFASYENCRRCHAISKKVLGKTDG